jgi:hypothetical protein
VIDDRARAEAILSREANLASLVPYDSGRSTLGAVHVIGVDEDWPGGSSPMAPLLQLNIAELPVTPGLLRDLAYVCFYLPPDDLPNSSPNGEGWEVRAYRPGERLRAVEAAPILAPFEPEGLRFESIIDYPDWDDASAVLERAGIDQDSDWYQEYFPGAKDGIKVGGWPALIQSEIYWAPWNRHPANPQFVLQLDSVPELDIQWGDRGVLYLGRGDENNRDVWAFEWQCY